MTLVYQCDDCGEIINPNRAFSLDLPHNQGKLHFCDRKCIVKYLDREFS